MAQIKKIVKPGDLIRGASVGLAGLDKDGNVVSAKYSTTDAGKMLSIDSSGNIVPVIPGSGKTYAHNITYYNESGAQHQLFFTLFSSDDTPLTYATAAALIFNQGFKERFKNLAAIGGITRDTNSYGLVCCVFSDDGEVIKVRFMFVPTLQPGLSTFTLPSNPTFFNDIVT